MHHREGVLLEPVMSHTDFGARRCLDPWTGCDERRVDDPAAVQDDVPDVPELEDGATYRGRDGPVRDRRPAERATDREVVVVEAVLGAGSEKAAAHPLGLSHSTVKHHLANARSKVGATTTAQLV